MSVTIQQLKCLKCEHEWLPRKFGRPQWCPNCNSPDWDEERKRPPMAEQRANARVRKLAEARQLLADAPFEITGTVIAPPTIQVPFFDNPPAGPWKEAIQGAEKTGLTADIAKVLGYKDGDIFVTADGDSMAAAGIPHGSLLLMRLLKGKKPPSSAVVLVQAVTSDGTYVSTIKHWYVTPTGLPDLRDGRNMPFYLPADVEQVMAIAVLVGMVAQRTFSYHEAEEEE